MSKAHLPSSITEADEPGALSLDELAGADWNETAGEAPKWAHEPTRRAGYGLSAVLDHNVTTCGGNRRETGEESLRGLLADLMHLADALQVDFSTVVEGAREMYLEEAGE